VFATVRGVDDADAVDPIAFFDLDRDDRPTTSPTSR
jgi:hypothetical protein